MAQSGIILTETLDKINTELAAGGMKWAVLTQRSILSPGEWNDPLTETPRFARGDSSLRSIPLTVEYETLQSQLGRPLSG